MPKINPEVESFARIKVIGVGGSGTNAVNHMVNCDTRGVEFIVMNTDAQHLHHSPAEKKIHIGKNLTRGLGTGMDPEIGRRAAEESLEDIQNAIKGADMVFVSCGLGGGTGTGAAPVIAKTAKDQGALTIAVVTRPFFFEGKTRMAIAEKGMDDLRKEVDAFIVIPNDRILSIVDKETKHTSAFAMCDEILRQAVEGISNTITMPGVINVDFADIRSIMQNSGSALMGIGTAAGETRAIDAARAAISSPLLDLSINGAKGLLFTISGGEDLTMFEIQDAAKVVTESVDNDAKVIFGTILDDKLKKNEIKITVIACGFPEGGRKTVSSFSPQERIIPEIKNDKKETNQPREIIEEEEEDVAPKRDRESFFRPRTPISESPRVIEEKDELGGDSEDDWSSIPAFLRRKK